MGVLFTNTQPPLPMKIYLTQAEMLMDEVMFESLPWFSLPNKFGSAGRLIKADM